jgi:hypothetical protein
MGHLVQIDWVLPSGTIFLIDSGGQAKSTGDKNDEFPIDADSGSDQVEP